MFYFAFALFTWFYFLELVKPRAKWLKYGFLAVLLGFIGLIAIRNVGFDGGGIQSTITRFVADPLYRDATSKQPICVHQIETEKGAGYGKNE